MIPGSKGEITVAAQSHHLTINKSRLTKYEITHHKGYTKKAANETRKKIETYYDSMVRYRKLSSAPLHNPERARSEVKTLYIDDLLDLYDEAFWSLRSRMRFWHQGGMKANEPPSTPFNIIDHMEHE